MPVAVSGNNDDNEDNNNDDDDDDDDDDEALRFAHSPQRAKLKTHTHTHKKKKCHLTCCVRVAVSKSFAHVFLRPSVTL